MLRSFLLWFLFAGLALVGYSAAAHPTPSTSEGSVHSMEGGTPIPTPRPN